MGTLSFDLEKFPDPKITLKRFADEEGISFMPIEEPYISDSLQEHRTLRSLGYLAKNCGSNTPALIDTNPWWGKGGMIDWTNPHASAYWHETKRFPLTQMGIRFHWTDLGEPEMYNDQACYNGFTETGKNKHADVHNIYNLKWSESIAAGYKNHHIQDRYFILSRSGTAGIQRYGTGMWSGDTAGNMGSLAAQHQVQGHISLSGIDYYGSDIGGFHRDSSLTDSEMSELYTQWFANSSLFDFPVRPHTWAYQLPDRQTSPARYGHVESNLANIRLRYELFPYYYTLSWNAYKNGDSIVSPMVYEFQEDKALRSIGHQKMIGPYLMAAVVARHGERERRVYLPKGKWVSWHTGEFFEGKNEFIDRVPSYYDDKFHIPLFIRSGAILPLLNLKDTTRNLKEALKERQKTLVLKLVPDTRKSSFDLYEDDYQTLSYQKGLYSLTRISQELGERSAIIRIDAKEKAETSRPYLIKVLLDAKTVQSISLNEKTLELCRPHSKLSCWENKNSNETIIRTQAQSDAIAKIFTIHFTNSSHSPN